MMCSQSGHVRWHCLLLAFTPWSVGRRMYAHMPLSVPLQGSGRRIWARQAIHAMDLHRIARTDKGQQRRHLWLLDILARQLIGKDPVDQDLLELTFGALIQCADAHLPDPLPLPWRATHPRAPVQLERVYDRLHTSIKRLAVTLASLGFRMREPAS